MSESEEYWSNTENKAEKDRLMLIRHNVSVMATSINEVRRLFREMIDGKLTVSKNMVANAGIGVAELTEKIKALGELYNTCGYIMKYLECCESMSVDETNEFFSKVVDYQEKNDKMPGDEQVTLFMLQIGVKRKVGQ